MRNRNGVGTSAQPTQGLVVNSTTQHSYDVKVTSSYTDLIYYA